MKNLNVSLLKRSPKLLSATIKMVAGKDLDSVLETFSELKGVPQKMGQLMSMDVTQFVPAELKEKLKPLQGQGKELDSVVMLDILKKELGDSHFSSIQNFQTKSLGAGSIGQVHCAQIENKKVVFKIQYPDMIKSIESDMALLNPISSIYELFRPQAKDFSILLQETKSMLLSELDYENEKRNLLYFKEKIQEDDRYGIPDILEHLSTKKVLCMDYVEGISLESFIKSNASKEQKLKVAEALLDLFINEFVVWGKVQTDPNYANYLIAPDGKIVLLDFGAVKSFEVSFRRLYLSLLNAAYLNDQDKILQYGEKLGLVHRSDSPEAIKLFSSFITDAVSFFHDTKNPVDFKNEEITNRLLTTGWKLFREQKISSPHSDLVFLHRKLGGLFSLLKEMKVEIDLHGFWKKIEAASAQVS